MDAQARRIVSAFFVCLIIIVTIYAQADNGAYAIPASDRFIVFDVFAEEGHLGTVTIRDGDMIRVTKNGEHLAISPIARPNGTFDFLLLDVGKRSRGRETLTEIELIEGATFGIEKPSQETRLSFVVVDILPPNVHEQAKMMCDRCCVSCYAYTICGCAVSSSCGVCCCEDCCELPE